MPSAFESRFASSRTLLLRHHGVAVGYQTVDGTDIVDSIGIVGPESADLVESPGGGERSLMRSRPFEISTEQVPTPALNDKVTLDPDGLAEVWTVHEIQPAGGGFAA